MQIDTTTVRQRAGFRFGRRKLGPTLEQLKEQLAENDEELARLNGERRQASTQLNQMESEALAVLRGEADAFSFDPADINRIVERQARIVEQMRAITDRLRSIHAVIKHALVTRPRVQIFLARPVRVPRARRRARRSRIVRSVASSATATGDPGDGDPEESSAPSRSSAGGVA